MRFPLRTLACLLLLTAPVSSQTPGAPGPDPAEIPIPAIPSKAGALPGPAELVAHKELPDVLVMNDGTRVTTPGQWQKRRQEMRRILSYYAVGQMPPAPGNVKGVEVASELVLDGTVKYRQIHLTFGPARKLALDIGVFTPVSGGPFPTIILQTAAVPGAPVLPRLPQGANQGRGEDVLLITAPERPVSVMPSPVASPSSATSPVLGRLQTAAKMASDRAEVFRRGYALVVYNPNDCAEDTTLRNPDGSWAFRNTRFFPAYPNYDWGILAGWAWGASRVADFLEHEPDIDSTKLIITGASRNGKSSMVAAAFDDRLSGAPVVTGGGGIGAYRYAGPRGSETLDIMQKKYPNWFSPHLHQFWGQAEKLPFDEHWFLALAAPRPYIALEGKSDTISLPEGVKASILAARPAYSLLGYPDRLGVHYSNHGHAFTDEDWTAMLDFFDKTLRGKSIEQSFDHFGPGTE